MSVVPKKEHELDLMRQASRIVALVLEAMTGMIAPGVTTAELDEVAERIIREHGAVPSFKGYPHLGSNDFPASICASINQEIVHGIPSPDRVLRQGDIVSIDVGTVYAEYQGDGAITVPVGQVDAGALDLIEVTRACLEAGIAQACPGNPTSDISRAIERCARSAGYEVVREYTGHGIGRKMHEDPRVPNYERRNAQQCILKEGMTIALEPMVNVGSWRTQVLPDGWTVETADGELSAHFEHTIAITSDGPEILTRLD